MADFHEVRFPADIAFGSTGGPERRTEIVTLGSGREQRNSRWAHSRRRFEAGYGIRSLDDLAAVIAFFEERRGRLCGFRFRDPVDFRSCLPSQTPAATDQTLGTGDGSTATFQLVKRYGAGIAPYDRPVRKPVAGTVQVAVNGAGQTADRWWVDVTSGTVGFNAGFVPAAGAVVTAGFEFDVPVRFEKDTLDIDLAAFEAGSVPSVPLTEIRV
ncbi:DUF2460 domain-containing protein [Pseudoxanthobacter sp.]|uniref:DUF2460 domain-containing protein n=1 Tax=Pseudoxanthobacter sp. TaxID=1925742 RepID=UPI002FDFAC5D